MYEPRTISIIASSFTLAVVIIAIALFSHFEWHQYKQIRQYHPPSWEYILSILITTVTATAIVGFSISILVFSVFYNEKWIEVLLLLSGRALLMQQAVFLWRFLRGMRIRSTSQSESWAKKVDTILGNLHLIVLCVSACFFGTTIFITKGLFRHQNRCFVLKLSSILLALEFLGLSSLYVWLIWQSRRLSTSFMSYYKLVLAFVPSLLGCLSATILALLGQQQIDWVLASWIHFGTVALWLIRSIVIGVTSFLIDRRTQRVRTPSVDRGPGVLPRPYIQGFNELADNT